MVEQREELTPGQVFGKRLREVRKRRDWTQQQLADRLTELGHNMHRVTIAKIEQRGKRAQLVGLEDVLAISYALGVSPLHMIVPFDPDARLRVVSKKQAVDSIIARAWLRGEETLLDEDLAFFRSEMPHDDIQRQLEQARRVTLDEDDMRVLMQMAADRRNAQQKEDDNA